MKHIDATLPDPLAQALDAYVNDQKVPPSTSAIVQAANKAFLSEHGYLPSFKKRLRITPAPHGSGYIDTSINHDLRVRI